MLNLPVDEELRAAETVLVAGCGGGFDVFAGLPLFFALRRQGKTVHLANLTFTTLRGDAGRRPIEELVEITAASPGEPAYFPEKHLCAWFLERGEHVPVWAIERVGPAGVTRAYAALLDELRPDTIILVDGGTDSLMRGDEPGLGTPVEDIASLCAADAADVPRKFLACIGFGIDAFHQVGHYYVLEAVSDLARDGGYLGASSLTRDLPEARLFIDASKYVLDSTSRPSIVLTSIMAAVEGQFGNFQSTTRTAGSELFINPLMSLYWWFNVDHVARRNLYLDRVRRHETYGDTEAAIELFRATLPDVKPWRSVPL
jgi:hypothetical protein